MAVACRLCLETTHGRTISELAVPFPVDLDPSSISSVLWIVMCPMYHAALVVPFVFTAKGHPSTRLNRYPRGKVNIVGYEKRMIRRDAEDEPLVPWKLKVVRKYSLDRS